MKRKYSNEKLTPTNMVKTCLIRKDANLNCIDCPYEKYCEGKDMQRPIRKGVDLFEKFRRL